jgi:hypothetical protein
MTRQLATQYVQIVGASGLESLRCILQASWSYAVAADASVQIHGTAYFAIRIRLASVDRKTTSLVNLHLAAPPLSGAHTGKSVYNLTASVLTALDSNWARSCRCNLRWSEEYDRLLFELANDGRAAARASRRAAALVAGACWWHEGLDTLASAASKDSFRIGAAARMSRFRCRLSCWIA